MASLHFGFSSLLRYSRRNTSSTSFTGTGALSSPEFPNASMIDMETFFRLPVAWSISFRFSAAFFRAGQFTENEKRFGTSLKNQHHHRDSTDLTSRVGVVLLNVANSIFNRVYFLDNTFRGRQEFVKNFWSSSTSSLHTSFIASIAKGIPTTPSLSKKNDHRHKG